MQSDAKLRIELSKTQSLVQNSMAEALAKLKLKCENFAEGFPRADMGAAVNELKGMIRRAKILPERLAGSIRTANRLQANKQ